MRQYELVEFVKSYDKAADEELLDRAYVFAMRAHGTQRRASGDPYFQHPVEVAGILAGLKLDSATIATALLHDTVEDTGATLDEIERLFGGTVARLVDGVTKLNRIELQSADTAQAENFRKLLLAMSEDIRVLLVKLADRLHNMRTLRFIDKPEKRRRIATETLEIYVPLSERIGMDKLKAELEDAAFAELWPDARESVLHRLGTLRTHDEGLVARIEDELRQCLAQEGIEADVHGREKSPLSIWRKMERKNVSFEQLSDIMAFRILVDSVSGCYAALGVIHARHSMMPGRFKDFISTPKPNGYRSVHTTIIGPEQRKIEVQIRTHLMHEVAELGVAAHWAYKQEMPVTDGKQYRWVRELLDILEHTSEPEDFLEHTKLEMFRDQVFCFTPRGDVIALPRGATALDFAYAVHSEVGDRCVGAKVDGRIVQLRTVLDNGDQVEIITSRSGTPSAAWERFAVTGKARARIRRFLRSKQRADVIARGRGQLERAAKAARLQLSEKRLDKVCNSLKHKSTEDLLHAVGDGTVSVRSVLAAVAPDLGKTPHEGPERENVIPFRRNDAAVGDGSDLPIDGLPKGVAFQYAGCCRPVRGDPIIGVIRTGRPVAIHTLDCGTVARLRGEDHRTIELGWSHESAPIPATARLAVMVLNQPGALGTVSTIIGKQGSNITDIRVGRRTTDFYEMLVDVEVADIEQLNRVQAALRADLQVTTVDRVQG